MHTCRERIPERVVHARGMAAKGFFEVTHDVSDLTLADFLKAPGTRTPLIVRCGSLLLLLVQIALVSRQPCRS